MWVAVAVTILLLVVSGVAAYFLFFWNPNASSAWRGPVVATVTDTTCSSAQCTVYVDYITLEGEKFSSYVIKPRGEKYVPRTGALLYVKYDVSSPVVLRWVEVKKEGPLDPL
jgi:hypothetical protein